MTIPLLPTQSLDDPNHRRRVVESVNELIKLLNTIESDSWTATILGSGTAGTYETSAQFSRYSRVGRRVWLDFYVQLAAAITGGGTGSLNITGLPFAKASGGIPKGKIVLQGVDWAAGASLACSFDSVGATSTLYIEETNDNAAISAVQISGVAANDIIAGSICYETDDP